YSGNYFKNVDDVPANQPKTYSEPTSNENLTSVTLTNLTASTNGYYYHTGQRASSKDPTGNTTYSHFFDSNFSRPTSTVLPDGGWSYSTYTSTETQAVVYTGITAAYPQSAGAGIRQDETVIDSLARPLTHLLLSDHDA